MRKKEREVGGSIRIRCPYASILYYTKILEVNLFAFAYRLFHRDFSQINGTYCIVLYGKSMSTMQCPID